MSEETELHRFKPRLTFSQFFFGSLIGSQGYNHWFEKITLFLSEWQILNMVIFMALKYCKVDEPFKINGLFQEISKAFSFWFIDYSKKSTVILFIVLTGTYMLLLLVIEFWIFLEYLLKKWNMQRTSTKILKVLLVVHYRYLFPLSHIFSLSFFKFIRSQPKFSGFGFLLLLNIISLLNILQGILGSKYCYEPFPTNNHIATRSSSFEFIGFIYRVVEILLQILITSDANKWLRSLTTILFMLLRWINLNLKFPYHDFRVLRAVYSINSAQLCTAILTLLAFIFEFKAINFIYCMVATVLFSTIGSVLYLNQETVQLSTQSISHAQTPDAFFKKLVCYEYVMNQGAKINRLAQPTRENIYELVFMSIILKHRKSCKNVSCACSLLVEGETSNEHNVPKSVQNSRIEKLYFELRKELFIKGIKKIKKNDEIKLAFANFLFNSPDEKNLYPAIIIHASISQNTRFTTKLKAYYLLEKIEDKIAKSYINSNFYLNAGKFFDYDFSKTKLFKALRDNIERYIQFWELYQSSNVKIRELINKAEIINRETLNISKIWKVMCKIQDFAVSESLDYSLYMSLVGNAPFTAKKILKSHLQQKQSRHFEPEISPQNVNHLKDALIYFSVKTGKIDHASINKHFLGYTATTLTGKNIKELMIEPMRNEYHNLLANPLEAREQDLFHKNHFLCAVDQEGFIAPVSVYIAPVPYMKSDLVMLAVMRQLHLDEEYLLINKDGQVRGFSKKLAEILKLDPILMEQYNLKGICSNIDKVLEVIGTNSKKVKDVKTIEALGSDIMQSKKATSFSMSETGYLYSTTMEQNTDFRSLGNVEFYLDLHSFDPQNSSQSKRIHRFDASIMEKTPLGAVIFKLKKSTRIYNEKESEDSIENLFKEVDEGFSQPNSPARKAIQGSIFRREYFRQFVQNETSMVASSTKQNMSYNINLIKKFSMNPRYLGVVQEEAELEKRDSIIIGSELEFMDNTVDEKKQQTFHNLRSNRSSVASSANEERREQRLEKAIYYEKEESSLKLLNFSLIVHMGISIILLIIYLLYSNKVISGVPNIVEIQEKHRTRLYWAYDNYWNSWLALNIVLARLSGGFGFSDRDYWDWLFEFYYSDGLTITLKNNEIRQSLHYLEPEHQAKLFRPLKVTDKYSNEVRYANCFELINEIGMSATQFYYKYAGSPVYPPAMEPNLEFIRSNSANELLLIDEEFFDILADDVSVKMDRIGNFVIVIFVVVVGISMLMYFTVVALEVKYTKQKFKFVDSFLRIQDDQVADILEMSRKLKQLIHEKNYDNKSSRRLDLINKEKEGRSMSLDARNFKRKTINLSGLNTRTYTFLFLLLVFEVAVASVCVALNGIYQDAKDTTNLQMQRMTKTSKVLFKFSSTTAGLYNYISTDGTGMMRGKPISEEWEKDYEELSASIKYFIPLREGNENFTEHMDYYLTGNLCEEIFLDDTCTKGIPRQGTVAINNFVISALRYIKDFYDTSNRTDEAKRETFSLSIYRDLENMYFVNALMAYEGIQTLLKEDMFRTLDSTKSRSAVIILVFSVCLILFTRLIWYPIWKDFVRERNTFNRILRVIPVNIIIRNGYLKTYLISHAGRVLSSLKHTL